MAEGKVHDDYKGRMLEKLEDRKFLLSAIYEHVEGSSSVTFTPDEILQHEPELRSRFDSVQYAEVIDYLMKCGYLALEPDHRISITELGIDEYMNDFPEFTMKSEEEQKLLTTTFEL